jgi:hypothetical protein
LLIIFPFWFQVLRGRPMTTPLADNMRGGHYAFLDTARVFLSAAGILFADKTRRNSLDKT